MRRHFLDMPGKKGTSWEIRSMITAYSVGGLFYRSLDNSFCDYPTNVFWLILSIKAWRKGISWPKSISIFHRCMVLKFYIRDKIMGKTFLGHIGQSWLWHWVDCPASDQCLYALEFLDILSVGFPKQIFMFASHPKTFSLLYIALDSACLAKIIDWIIKIHLSFVKPVQLISDNQNARAMVKRWLLFSGCP